MRIDEVQRALTDQNLSGWLFCDIYGRDRAAQRVLELGPAPSTRRWYYFIPASGQPVKITSRIERHILAHLPGRAVLYSGREELAARLQAELGGRGRVAMQYSPGCELPAVSLCDGGTVELMRALGNTPVCSGDLLQAQEALLTREELASHRWAGDRVHGIFREVFAAMAGAIRAGRPMTERGAMDFIQACWARDGLTSDGDLPYVAVDDHAQDPGYIPTAASDRPIVPGSRILIDFWARRDAPGAVYYDITWAAYAGSQPPAAYRDLAAAVFAAREEAKAFIRGRFAAGQPVAGWEVDAHLRAWFAARGLDRGLAHRTGHSMGGMNHFFGANLDDFETHDTRRLLPGSLFSIEPGLYLDGMGVRSEINAYLTPAGDLEVHGPEQTELVLLAI